MNAAPGLLILVATDDPDTVAAIAMVFHAKGCQTLGAYDGPTTLALAELAHPDLVLLDAAMPGVNGYDVARQFRLVPELQHVVIACLSGDNSDHDRELACEAGCDTQCSKPVALARLDQIIERTLQLRREHARLGVERARLLAEVRTSVQGLRSYWNRYHE